MLLRMLGGETWCMREIDVQFLLSKLGQNELSIE